MQSGERDGPSEARAKGTRNSGGGGKTTVRPVFLNPGRADAQSLIKRLGFDPKGCGSVWGIMIIASCG